jgi:hypothetical protein
MKKTWNKIKAKMTPEVLANVFVGTIYTGIAVSTVALIYYAIRDTNAQIDEYNTAVKEQNDWLNEQTMAGRMITYLPDGTPWAFDPWKPLLTRDGIEE